MGLQKRITVSWSGGKDAALALHRFLQNEENAVVVHLHCVLRLPEREVGLHGIPETLIDAQAASMKLPLVRYYMDEGSNESYEALAKSMYADFVEKGITHILFGDIFLEDLRAYRVKLLEGSGLTPIFPLWNANPGECVDSLIKNRFRCVVSAANQECYDAGLLGKEIDRDFVNVMPDGVDPAGENGEYHTFVADGPLFNEPIAYSLGGVTRKEFSFSLEADKKPDQKLAFYFQEVFLRKERNA